MALAGRQSVPGLDGGRSRQLYHCRVEGCEQTPSGRYLAQHYKNSADWRAFKQLKAAVGNKELTRLKGLAEPHTLFLFENGYNENLIDSFKKILIDSFEDFLFDQDRQFQNTQI